MRNVDESTGKITGIGSLERGIGKSLTCTVGRDEVLEHCHTLLKVGNDRILDNLGTRSTGFLRFCHKSSHTAELFDLLGRSTGSGIKHHVNRVESLLVSRNLLLHDTCQLVVDRCPQVDDLVVTLVIRNESHSVVVLDVFNLFVSGIDELVLFRRNKNVSKVE